VTTRFEADTAVRPEGDGLFALNVDGDWNGPQGPNGGYVAALLLRAITTAVNDPERCFLSVTFHYPGRPNGGPASAEVAAEHRGRSVTFATGTIRQEGLARMGAETRSGGWVRFSRVTAQARFRLPTNTWAWRWRTAGSRHSSAVSLGTWASTVDFTIHFPSPPIPKYVDWVLANFRSDVAGDGMVIEDGELWTNDGRLLAISRQMCIIKHTVPA
jgi:acyl-coenzyme A thioesterase PaaI-like protein